MRILNIDWLEVYCIEPQKQDAKFFQEKGYKVEQRQYGTPIYEEMFTIYHDDMPFIEVRRNPYSKKSTHGIMPDKAVHLRLSNEACYEQTPIDNLRLFMTAFNYQYVNISRIDIALDFNIFDNFWNPQHFINEYMQGNISKVNQTNVAAHGTDTWAGRVFNSLKWGAPTSPISTKLYNKTQEMMQQTDKPYIKEWWIDPDGDNKGGLDVTKDVWRIEFSVKAQAQARKRKTKESFVLHLWDYDTKEKLWQRFYELYVMYFDFRQVEYTSKGTIKRKYDCTKIYLFDFSDNEVRYTPARKPRMKKKPDRVYKIMINRLEAQINKKGVEREYKEAFTILINYLQYKCNLEIRNIHFEEEEELLKLESYRNRLSQYEIDDRKDKQERRERQILKALMNKYGIIAQPEGCPF